MMSASTISKEKSDDPVLPLELFDLVIENIRHPWTSTSQATLRACSLVCKAFVPLCRQHLFSVIHVHRSQVRAKPHFHRLSEIFKNEPSITVHVRKIHFGFDESEYTLADDQNDDPFNSFLGLPYLESLNIDSAIYGEETYPSYCVNPTIFPVRLLKSYLQLGNLINLSLVRIADLPIIDVLSLPRLSQLKIDECLIDPEVFQDNNLQYNFSLKHFHGRRFEPAWFVILTRCCSDLETINVHGTGYHFFNRPRSAFQVLPTSFTHKVHTLAYNEDADLAILCSSADALGVKAFPGVKLFEVVSLGDMDVNDVGNCPINRLLQHLPAMERLVVNGGKRNSDIFAGLDLNQYIGSENLKSITIKWRDYEAPDESPVVHSLTRFLRLIRGHNSVETIHLEQRVKPSRRWPTRSFRVWRKLDQTLLENRRAHFPSLKRVLISLRLKDKDEELTEEDVKRFEEPWKEPLKGLFATSDIVFQHTVEPLRLSRSEKWLRDFKRQMRALNLDD